MGILGIDLGTTHCKAGFFAENGTPIAVASLPAPQSCSENGELDPEGIWERACEAVRHVLRGEAYPPVQAIGVASVAEAGLLVDHAGRPRTPILPWFDARALQQMERIGAAEQPLERFRRSGLPLSLKYGLAKILWLRERDPSILRGAVWLSVADYVVFRLTRELRTDPSLAVRTYAYRLREGVWDEPWLAAFGLDAGLFPPVGPAGTPAGGLGREAADELGLPPGIPVAVSGHDHVCAAFAAGLDDPGQILDSMGTAESLLGTLDIEEPGARELDSGLAVVPHVVPNRRCWLGGVRAAGGSIEWLRRVLGEAEVGYGALERLAAAAGPGPTGILYYPYLAGSGSPRSDERLRGAFIGLGAEHGRGHLVRAVLEGTAYEAEWIRRNAVALTGQTTKMIVATGGGARNREWLQIKADVSGCVVRSPVVSEYTLLGAALAAARGAGVLDDASVKALTVDLRAAGDAFASDRSRHERYREIFEAEYLPFQTTLRGRERVGRSVGRPRGDTQLAGRSAACGEASGR
ncbi:MAG TPA: FGGY family carbohydrate kinase [Chloroflexota bacterium]|nr:FGGY family carbohydrate kinase [Chloroflexota bacterium]